MGDQLIDVEESSSTENEEPEGQAVAANEFVAALTAMVDLPRLPQQARSRAKRERIIEVAIALFATKGYEATGIDDIATAADVSVGTFYGYFRNKQQVFLAYTLEQIGESLAVARMIRLDFSKANPREMIRQGIEKTLGNYDQLQMYRIWLEMVIGDPSMAAFEQQVYAYIIGELQDSLLEIKAQGRTWPDLDVEVTATSIVLLLDNVNLRYTLPIEHTRLINGLTDVVYRMVFPPDSHDE